jgi:membrane protease YdiL (CAAX protease family)
LRLAGLARTFKAAAEDSMTQQMLPHVRLPEAVPPPHIPWSLRDVWLGLALVFPAVLLGVIFSLVLGKYLVFEAAETSVYELLYALPVIAILAWRKARWSTLGFRRFDGRIMGIGCGLLAAAYLITVVHNSILIALGVDTQGDELIALLRATRVPAGIVVGAIIAAPLAEEIFFRGFMFQGMRQAYGWNKAGIVSAAVFAVMHFQPVALLPTFLMGYLLALVFDRSNSIWPGVILHFLMNAFAVLIVLLTMQLGNVLPLPP